jgi:pimeloyl-ACP methyl ester carboxylesterase
MPGVKSADGTTIAYDKNGDGPALVVVDGALTSRRSSSKPELITLLSPRLTVYTYDRRGRGDSGDTLPYAVAREIDDIEAVIGEAGGAAALYGHSSGACLALDATLALGGKVTKLAMYEAPYDSDQQARPAWERYLRDLAAALGDGRSGDAVALFMSFVGTPSEQVASMRQSPFWPELETIGPTLAYDHAGILGADRSVPLGRAARVRVPALVMNGEEGAPFMAETARALHQAIPGAELRTLAAQGHNVSPEALAPLLTDFVTR